MKRLPAGFGSVSKLSDAKHRYKPYRAVLTIGYEIGEDGKAKQIRKLLGTFETHTEAMNALAAYKKEPYEIQVRKLTFSQVYEDWLKGFSIKQMGDITNPYNRFSSIYSIPFVDLRLKDYEPIFEPQAPSMQKRMKTLLHHMYDYAIKHDIVQKDYSKLIETVKIGKKKDRKPFSADEIKTLWQHEGDMFVDFLLVSIYSGWRTVECLEMKIADGYMVGGSKTEAGMNRRVPIHPKIEHILKRYPNGFQYSYNVLTKHCRNLFKEWGWDHVPYETRHTFVTGMKECGVDDNVIKVLVGHTTKDVTEAYYTHRTMQTLQKAINQLEF